ncbi:MAG: serine/threonine protein kinase, partial [Deltaproteobacteria bacterium]|nr:serine/threonine protein kinase [Deltaproteobacteria bacterium]
MTLDPGTKVGPYEVEGPLGAGGMGEVYRARDPRLGRSVALKILPPGAASDPDRRRRFEVEARAASALNHPAIVALFDVGFHDDRPYLVAELLEGATLRARLGDGPLAVRKALDYARQIAEGLAAAHEHGIIHRDLKPENLFVTRDGRLKILDFGLAKALGPTGRGPAANGAAANGAAASDPAEPTATEAGTVFGTAGYMSPEQVRGQTVDHRSDIFSFGAVLYEMLAGHRAFPGESPIERAHAILKDEPPAFAAARSVPAAVGWLVWRCLEKEPAQRFQAARDLAFSLEAMSELPSGGAAAAALAPRPRRAAAATLGAVILVVALAGLGYVSWRKAGRPEDPPAATTAAVRPAPAAPHYRRLSFRRGAIASARFAPDGASVIYGAAFEGAPYHVYSAIPGNPEARQLFGPRVGLLGVSRTGDLALALAPKEGEDKHA